MKIVINRCYGGFGLSDEAEKKMGQKSWDIKRDDPKLVEIVETMGKAANGFCAELAVIEIPDGVDWVVEEYDGNEWVAEVHQTWG